MVLYRRRRRIISVSHNYLPLRVIECMALQNTSLLPELLSQLDKPEEWYDYTYSNPTVNNGVIPLYAQYEKDIKTRVQKYM